MLKIAFIPETDAFTVSAEEYAKIWSAEGNRITSSIEQATGLEFKVRFIKAIIFEGISQSNPLKLRASYDKAIKKATLVHELLHHISSEYMLDLPIEGENLSLGLHKQINLVLYDLWLDLYGQEFAEQQVQIESARTPMYKEAWEWALSFPRAARQSKFTKLRN